MENSKILLGEVGEWILYKFYFDRENNCFIEEKYHHEYLDTGTVLDDSNVVSAQQVYMAFIEYMNTDGITNLIKYADDFELPQVSGNQITKQGFLEKLEEIDRVLRYRLEIIDSTYILRDQQGSIIGVLSKTKYFFAYVDLSGKRKGFVSENEAFAYAIECLNQRYKLSNSVTVVDNAQSKEQGEKIKKSNRIRNIFSKI